MKVQNVVVVGGGTAGWTAAAAIKKLIGANLNVVLVESDAIGTVGVGEATIPPFRTMHRLLKIDEADIVHPEKAETSNEQDKQDKVENLRFFRNASHNTLLFTESWWCNHSRFFR